MIRRIVRWLIGEDDGGPPRLPSPDELVVAASPQGEPEAEMLRGMLAQHGIHSMLRNRDAWAARTAAPGGWFAYELMVMRKDLRRAREILALDATADESP
jgi:hypothetical protein